MNNRHEEIVPPPKSSKVADTLSRDTPPSRSRSGFSNTRMFRNSRSSAIS
jgi:hypothetical protein